MNSAGVLPKPFSMDEKGLHDHLLEHQPERAAHDKGTCPFCAMGPDDANGRVIAHDATGGGTAVKTFTEDELKAAVDKAVADATADLQTKLKSFEESATEAEIEAKLDAAKTELQTKVDELQTQLDAAVLEAKGEKDKREAIEAWLTEEGEKAEHAKEIASRRDDRLAKVKEVANFPEEYLEKNADRFAAMSDEDFEARLEEYREIASKGEGSGIPAKTALTAAREDTNGKGRKGTGVSEVFGLRFQGIDPRTL